MVSSNGIEPVEGVPHVPAQVQVPLSIPAGVGLWTMVLVAAALLVAATVIT